MSDAWAASRTMARHMLRHGAGEQAGPDALAEAAERAAMRLRARLAGLIGSTGYTILMARAVRMARAEAPALDRITVDAGAEGVLHGVREFAWEAGSPRETEAGLTAILGNVIGLLVSLIGEDLAIRLIREAWPELAHSPFDKEGQQ